ncbi:MAG: hypothetical protein ISR82_06800 [Candidatus Marinimicrobia bacterium]|nr:hypothetical protein [Candidatus Neomarinimicrobiota bacterium]MBL7010913.1 hypothetical protein [Candidatus Neomarinimicrobiota bacterium]MBL7031349.1 hypothetical protein [Candidatus Neomarinimicrobiota bacterium]
MTIKSILASILIVQLSTGCMHQKMGMHDMMGKGMMGMGWKGLTKVVRETNSNKKMDVVIDQLVKNLQSQPVGISNIAVWRIRSQAAGLNVELLRTKLIEKLVASQSFQVISRDRLDQLLQEKELALSGMINEKNAGEIGSLIGVDGFIDGVASLDGGQLVLSLNLIETISGKILWAKTGQSK